MDFIYVWCDDRYKSKVLLSTIPIPGPDLEVKVTDLECLYKRLKFFHLNLYNSMYIWHDGRYRSRVLLSMIPTHWGDFEVNVT